MCINIEVVNKLENSKLDKESKLSQIEISDVKSRLKYEQIV